MIKERYVSFETAKLLKEKGFKQKLNKFCDENSICYFSPWGEKNSKKKTVLPTHQMACDWLRSKGLYPEILTQVNKTYTYQIVLFDDADDYDVQYGEGVYNDYAECVESAIKYCLTELMRNESK